MLYVIRIVENADGTPSIHANKFIKSFTPEPEPRGTMSVTDKPEEAVVFPDQAQAWEYWKQEHGTRHDGKPNRPLTAFSVLIQTWR
jgi:hypothetical protein